MTQKQTKQGGRPVNLRDRVEMTSTDAHPIYKRAGVQFKVHSEQVKKLTDNNWAVAGHVAAADAALATGEPAEPAKKVKAAKAVTE